MEDNTKAYLIHKITLITLLQHVVLRPCLTSQPSVQTSIKCWLANKKTHKKIWKEFEKTSLVSSLLCEIKKQFSAIFCCYNGALHGLLNYSFTEGTSLPASAMFLPAEP